MDNYFFNEVMLAYFNFYIDLIKPLPILNLPQSPHVSGQNFLSGAIEHTC